MKQPLHLTVFLVFSTSFISCLETNYYWREYTGKIPSDAVIGGQDVNQNNIYIGQAYVKNSGLIVVRITPGDKNVYAAIHGTKKLDKHIKILCGPLNNFAWLSTNASRLHVDLIDKQAVIGGHEDEWGSLNIGRISHEGSTQIGKVNAFYVDGNAKFYFIDRNKKELEASSYEVLIYHTDGVQVDLRSAFDAEE